MTSGREFDALLRSWFDESASSGPPQGLLESVLTATAHTRPRPAWLVGLHGEPMLETGHSGLNRFAPIALAATAVVVAILIGIGLLVRLTNVGPPSVPIATPFPTAHAQNGRIAMSANPINVFGGEDGDIYLLGQGAAARRIIGSDGDGVAQACPKFSPDGHRLAYGEARASDLPVTTFRGVWPVSDRAVVVVELNGHGDASVPIMRVALPTDPGQIACPEWSPSGTQVAFRVGPELWVADAISGKATVFPVTEAPWGAQGFAWSRDGSLIAVAEPGLIRVVRMDGGASTLIPVKGGTPGSLGWTAGDDRIIYISPDDPPLSNRRPVHAVGVNGNNDAQLTPDSADPGVDFYSDNAVVSPDGTRVAFVQAAYRCTTDGCTTQARRVLTMGTNGSNLVELQTPPDFGGGGLQWSPDGKRLLSGVVSVGVAPGSPAVVYARDGELNLEWSGWEFTWQPVFP